MFESIEQKGQSGLEIAVIGMAGRFPGARDINAFWDNLKNGVESISFFSEKKLEESGMNSGLYQAENFVKTFGGTIENKEYFDAMFFNYTPTEATVMNPQMRLFHEYAWHALEDAGYDSITYAGAIGIYGGAYSSFYWEGLTRLSGSCDELGSFDSNYFNDSDFLATRIAYKLGLKGPAFTVQTACSTSLVAIHLACQGLLGGECDMALAGGVTIVPGNSGGYLFQEGMILSPDGHCRAFDARTKGTTVGNGLGIVLLKPLQEAIAARDHIYAVIKGTAINNDGIRKIGYAAPSMEGQAEVINMALQVAETEPESITYVETHGTGTILGDPVEIEGLKLAFNTDKKGYCAVGSVKTNIGHLDAAAGAAGFIKTVLALKHRLIPPSLHFENPNPKIDFENSPFYVNHTLSEWKSGQFPLRAGVSSFGIGGTNAHIILEEAPLVQRTERKTQGTLSQGRDRVSPSSPEQDYQLILLSAKTETALEQMTQNLAAHLKNNPGINLDDVAYTLQIGRRPFKHRKMLVCPGVQEAIAVLSSPDSSSLRSSVVNKEKKSIVFMFPGLGEQHVNMGLDLYCRQPVFRREMDHCFAILQSLIDYDIKEILYPADLAIESNDSTESSSPIFHQSNSPNTSHTSYINNIDIAPIILFAVEYALSKLLITWGITPDAMIGYSFGEYVAACLSEVFSLEDALKIVVLRSRLIKETPAGAMLSVPLPKGKLQPFLNETVLSLAVDNGPSCIVSGPALEIDAFQEKMKEKRCVCVRLTHASQGIHSHMMEDILEKYRENLSHFTLKKPQIPFISNVTGTWTIEDEVTKPAYWAAHLRQSVRFADGIKELLQHFEPGSIFVEVGPGYDLSVLIRHHMKQPGHPSEPLSINLMDHQRSNLSGSRYLLNKLGQLWLYGVNIDWETFHAEAKRYRVPLPPYPFESQPYRIDEQPLKTSADRLIKESKTGKKPDIADWFYIPSWKRSLLPLSGSREFPRVGCWLVFMDECGLGTRLLQRLNQAHQDVIIVKRGFVFKKVNPRQYTINPHQADDYHNLFKELRKINKIPNKIVHLWSITKEDHLKSGSRQAANPVDRAGNILNLGFYSLFYFAQASGKQDFRGHMDIVVVSNNLFRVSGEEMIAPEKAALLGAVKVIPKEYTNINCRCIDIVLPGSGSWEEETADPSINGILAEFSMKSPDTVLAYRGDYRWIQMFEPVRLEKPPQDRLRLKQQGVYLVTGGLGGIGLVLAGYLAKKVKAKLILTARSKFPAKEEWHQWQLNHKEDDPVSQKIDKLKNLEEQGAEVLVYKADTTDAEQMKAMVNQALKKFGQINGVIHAAGIPDGAVIPLRSRETTDQVLAPKVIGTLVLDDILKDVKLDFFVNCSSISAILGPFGQIGYSAANAFQDAYAYRSTYQNGVFTLSINWDMWQEVGFAAEKARELKEKENIADPRLLLKSGILPIEGVDVFERLLNHDYPQVVVYTRDLNSILEERQTEAGPFPQAEIKSGSVPRTTYQRPELSTEYVPPRTEFQKMYSQILQKFFGFQQVGIHDNLFEYGATSLNMIHINGRLKKMLNKDIPIEVMFEYPTIHSLEQYLEKSQPADSTEMIPGKDKVRTGKPGKVKELMHDSIHLIKQRQIDNEKGK